jgi:hypothetical protein
MGKGKRNRDRKVTFDEAQQDVRDAEEVLAEARRRARIAAAAQRGNTRRQQMSARASRKAIDLDTGTASPEDQAAAFFNRPGDYFEARFIVYTGHNGEKLGASTVLKADESQFDYLLEVLRQIRGGFGEAMRIELTRTHTVEAPPEVPDALTGLRQAERNAARRNGRRIIPDGQPMDMRDFHLGERYGSDDPEFAAYAAGVRAEAERRDLTREELAAQLPGQTRAEVAEELSRDPRGLGDTIKHVPPETTPEALAAELGVPVESLTPLPMTGGGMAYSIKPPEVEPDGKHAAPIRHHTEPEADLMVLAGKAWAGPGWYVARPRQGAARNVNAATTGDLLGALTVDDVEVYKARQIRDEPQA